MAQVESLQDILAKANKREGGRLTPRIMSPIFFISDSNFYIDRFSEEGEVIGSMKISISASAKKFMKERDIQDVTFRLTVTMPAGCSLGIVKEIEPAYWAVENAANYRYFQAEGRHIFVSRDIRIMRPLTLITEGFWKMRRLALDGATIPI